MAITNTSKITGAINKQGNSTQPGLGCGAVYVEPGRSLPAGDYVAVTGTSAAAAVAITNIVWKGAPWTDDAGIPITTLSIDVNRLASYPWFLNIESCDVADSPVIFYKRCK